MHKNYNFFNIINARIDKAARSAFKKDVLSILYLFWILLSILVAFIFFVEILLKFSIPNIVQLITAIISISKMAGVEAIDVTTQKLNSVTYNEVVSVAMWELRNMIVIIIPLMLRLFFKKLDFLSEAVCILSSMLALVAINNAYITFILGIIPVIIFIIINPLGSGRYYNTIKNFEYLFEVLENYFETNPIIITKKQGIQLGIKAILIILSIIVFSCLILRQYSVNLQLPAVVLISFVILVYLNKSTENKVITLIKKIILFSSFFAIVIYTNLSIKNEIGKILLLVSTIYFSLDRIASISKEVKQIIRSESILFYMDNENVPNNELVSEFVDTKFIDRENISEQKLVIQMLLRIRFNMIDQFKELMSCYRKRGFVSYLQILKAIEYQMMIDDLSVEERKETIVELEELVNLKNQKIHPVFLFLEYADMLYLIEKYNEAIEIYEEFFLYLDTEKMKKLYSSYIKRNMVKEAEKIKKHYTM